MISSSQHLFFSSHFFETPLGIFAFMGMIPKRIPLIFMLRFSVFPCIAIVFAASLSAQPDANPRELTLTEVISLALNQNLALQRSGIQIELRENEVLSEEANFGPNLTGSAGASTRFSGNGRDPVWDTGAFTESANASLNSSLTLYSGESRKASLEQAKASLEASFKDFDRSQQQILFQSVARYLEAVLRLKEIDIQAEELATRQENLERIEVDYENEIRILADVQRQKALVADSERRLAEANRAYQNSLYLLKDLLLLPPKDAIALNLDDTSWLEPENIADPSFGESLSRLFDRPDLLAQKFRLDAAEQNIRVARSGKKPTLSASASLRTNYTRGSPAGSLADQLFQNQPNASGGLSLSVPIFDRRRTETNVARARLQLDQEELSMKDLEQVAETDLRLALLNFNTAKLQLNSSLELLESAEIALEAEQARYEAGAATLLDVTTLQSTRLDAAVSVEEARFDLFVNRLDIAFQDGSIENFLLEQLNTNIPELE